MPESQFVKSSQLRPLLAYLTMMVIGLLIADALERRFAENPGVRTTIVLAWLFFLPLGGWRVWRRG